MSRLSRNDIRAAARAFAHEWSDETYERGEAQSFWTAFLAVFGVQRRRVNAAFERHARRSSTGGTGFIDLLWPGMLLAEHKSAGADLTKAMGQALDYIDSLNDEELPRLVVASNFEQISVIDLDDEDSLPYTFPIDELPNEIDRFLSLAGYTSRKFEREAAVDAQAAAILGGVYDLLETSGYRGHDLRVFIVRILFLLFSDDTGIWPRAQFADLVRARVAEDGSDLGMWIARLFEILDTAEGERTANLDLDLAEFPFVNGGLFHERIATPDTNRQIRDELLRACAFDWSQISPAVFGSMFQSVLDPASRRTLGAHYTTEDNILRVIRPLFLDDLNAELLECGSSKQKLRKFHEKISNLRFIDPACGCGNFLIVAYRELRKIETDVIERLNQGDVQLTLELDALRRVVPSQFAGIELEEFPARIAETAMYLVDHLENEKLALRFGANIVELPLGPTANIRCGNALEIDWNDVLSGSECSYVFGNPPFGGKHLLSTEQRQDMDRVFAGIRNSGALDYVSAWFFKAAEYMRGQTSAAALVATNSITQGEQVPVLWPLLHSAGAHITFAWKTFNWNSEAPRAANVHVVIIGFSVLEQPETSRVLFEPIEPGQKVFARPVKTLNGYLVPSEEVYPVGRSRPLDVGVPPVVYGAKPVDGGNLILDEDEFESLRTNDDLASSYVHPMLSASEFLNGQSRYCLWLEDSNPIDITRSNFLLERLSAVRAFRLDSPKVQTRAAADKPGIFGEPRRPSGDFIFIPIHSSAARRIVPMAFVDADSEAIVHNSGAYVENATLELFGVLQSEMFAVWQRTVGGRIKSDYRFNNRLVYNTFPFPMELLHGDDDVCAVVREILELRSRFQDVPIGGLYMPLTMPPQLVDIHRQLDELIDRSFTRRRLSTETDRQVVLFSAYAAKAGPQLDLQLAAGGAGV